MKTRRPGPDTFDLYAVVHLGVFLVAATWLFGGEAAWVRELLSWWGVLGVAITLGSFSGADRRRRPSVVRWIWPLLPFNVLVIASCLTPSYRALQTPLGPALAPIAVSGLVPCTPEPAVSLRALWLYDAIVLSAFNVLAVVRLRRAVRALLLVAVFNALALAVFGTLQQLVGSKGLFFGLVPLERQPFFFASFVYHNHWAAFTLLMIAACLALAWHYLSRVGARNLVRTPGFIALLTAVLLAITEPLSASRSGTLLLIPILGATGLHWLARLLERRRHFRESIALPIGGVLLAAVLASGAIWYLARDVIATRLGTTRQQLSDMRAQGGLGSRTILYRDTWRMARDRLLFGWGMGSYPRVFERYNSQEYSPVDGRPTHYYDAHNDWLQALAEHGVAGSALLALTGLVPLLAVRKERPRGVIPVYLGSGCALILAYAWVEFPFGNPAVALTWWILYFSAIQYAALSRRT